MITCQILRKSQTHSFDMCKRLRLAGPSVGGHVACRYGRGLLLKKWTLQSEGKVAGCTGEWNPIQPQEGNSDEEQ